MAYTIKKSNGLTIAVIPDGVIDISTDLTLTGKNYLGYGAAVNENFVYLLENFANKTAPKNPISGQLWWNTAKRSLGVYDGNAFRPLSVLENKATKPSDPIAGDLWFDTQADQLKVYNGVNYITIGPAAESAIPAKWIPQVMYDLDENPHDILNAFIDTTSTVIVSRDHFPVPNSYLVNSAYGYINSGISLPGTTTATNQIGISAIGLREDYSAIPTDGSSRTGYILWGTAASALGLVNPVDGTLEKVKWVSTATQNYKFYATTATITNLVAPAGGGTVYGTWTLASGATFEATYADIAERYEADSEYEPGTVLVVGGEKEVTTTTRHADIRQAGIVSTNPAYTLNAAAGNDSTHPYIALKGRVPCKVIGPINKGDILCSSTVPGFAERMHINDNPLSAVAKALGSLESGQGVIEVMVI